MAFNLTLNTNVSVLAPCIEFYTLPSIEYSRLASLAPVNNYILIYSETYVHWTRVEIKKNCCTYAGVQCTNVIFLLCIYKYNTYQSDEE